jgi:hypothetical protein
MSYVLDEEAAEVTEVRAAQSDPTRLGPDRKWPHFLGRELRSPRCTGKIRYLRYHLATF